MSKQEESFLMSKRSFMELAEDRSHLCDELRTAQRQLTASSTASGRLARSRSLSPAQNPAPHFAVRRELDVGWFQVAMRDAFLMRYLQGLANVPGNVQRFLDWDRSTPDTLRRRFAFHKFKVQEARTLRFL
jgi:hypothetical protein